MEKKDELVLRPTTETDLDFVLAAESDPDNTPYVARWTREEHQKTFNSPEWRHLIIEEIGELKRLGYVILQDVGNPNLSLQLRRIVAVEKGKGYGTRAIQLVKNYAFKELGQHRLWLDVKTFNDRARRVYRACGFVEEGILRECLKNGDRFESLVIMSVLKDEFDSETQLNFYR
jgi:RimJ/RimL family protein N-acetyltransferase